MPTVPGVWVGVPGGWSIEAEFAFYALFPLLMVTLRGPWSAVSAMAASLPLAWFANMAGSAAYLPLYGAGATAQFLYYWLPNQLPVFLCGLVAYESIVGLSPGGRWQNLGARLTRCSGFLLGASATVFASLALMPIPRLPGPESDFLASHVIAAAAFGVFTVALALRPMPLLVNGAIVRLGQASFSAYLLHFAVLETIKRMLPGALSTPRGMGAAAISGMLFVLVLCLTALAAQATYRLIELPAIRLGGLVIDRKSSALIGRRGGLDLISRITRVLKAEAVWRFCINRE